MLNYILNILNLKINFKRDLFVGRLKKNVKKEVQPVRMGHLALAKFDLSELLHNMTWEHQFDSQNGKKKKTCKIRRENLLSYLGNPYRTERYEQDPIWEPQILRFLKIFLALTSPYPLRTIWDFQDRVKRKWHFFCLNLKLHFKH